MPLEVSLSCSELGWTGLLVRGRAWGVGSWRVCACWREDPDQLQPFVSWSHSPRLCTYNAVVARLWPGRYCCLWPGIHLFATNNVDTRNPRCLRSQHAFLAEMFYFRFGKKNVSNVATSCCCLFCRHNINLRIHTYLGVGHDALGISAALPHR